MPTRASDLLTLTREGLYCPLGGFHVDPTWPVERALITHGHADHARAGHGHVLATPETLRIMAVRYGEDFCRQRQEARLGEALRVGDVTVRYAPAGHVLGSAQIAIERDGVRVVVSGDYKRAPDPTCLPFEVVPCDVFITEATFGLPVFTHPDTRDEVRKLMASVALFPERAHIVGAYALGKAQRVMALLREEGWDRPIHLHGAMEKLTELYKREGIPLGETPKVVAADRKDLHGAIVLCPPSAMQDLWSRKFPDPVTCFASGWMRVRARARQKGVELPLVISDHSDWPDLCRTIRDTGAGEVWVTHGQEDALVHWCGTQGIKAKPLHLLGYGDDGEAEPAQPTPPSRRWRRERFRPSPRPPRLRAAPQRQAADAPGFLRAHAGSGARLRARRHDRHAEFPRGQAGPDPRPGRGAHRPGAVPPVAQLRRRSRRDHGADLAGAADLPPPLGSGLHPAPDERRVPLPHGRGACRASC